MAPESLGAGDGAHGTERSSRHRTSEHGHLQGDAPADRARLEHEHDYGRPGWQPSLLCWKGRKSLDRSNSLRVQRSKGRSDAFRGTNRRASDSPGSVRPPSAPAGPISTGGGARSHRNHAEIIQGMISQVAPYFIPSEINMISCPLCEIILYEKHVFTHRLCM